MNALTRQQRQDIAVYLAARCMGLDAAAIVRQLQAARAQVVALHLAPPASWSPVREVLEAAMTQ
jgi:hypothetical protein